MLADEIIELPDVMQSSVGLAFNFRLIKTQIAQSQVILADNIAKYLFEDNDQEFWDIEKDFPNIAPPFPFTFIEFKEPSYIRSGRNVTTLQGRGGKVKSGVLIVASEVDDYKKLNKPRWSLSFFVFAKAARGKHPLLLTSLHLFCDENGKAVIGERGIPFVLIPGMEIERAPGSAPDYLLFVPLLTLSFLHCKNVEIVKQDIPEKLNKARLRRGKHPKIQYHILQIHPIKKILETEGGIGEIGLKRALHICRGHFKDFTGRGLFGKLQGIYWWDAHVRGDAKEGVTLKDYRVHAR